MTAAALHLVQPAERRRTFGSVRQLRSGRWQIRYRADGKMVPGGTFLTRKLADIELTKLHAKALTGTPLPGADSRQPFASYADDVLAARKRALSTRALYGQVLRTHVDPALGTLPLDKITPALVRKLAAGITGRSARDNAVKLVRTVMRQAVADHLIGYDPTQGIQLAGSPGHRGYPNAERVAAIIARISNVEPRYRFLVLLAAQAGLRWAELAGLRLSDVDLDAGIIRVTRQYRRVQGQARAVSGLKWDGEPRTAYLSDAMIAEARAHLAAYVPEPAASADGALTPFAADPPLFPGERFRVVSRAALAAEADALEASTRTKRTGRPMLASTRARLLATAATLRAVETYAEVPAAYQERGLPDQARFNRLWHRVLADLGIDPSALRLHDLRAYSATKGAEAGETLRETMARLGHRTPNAAMRYQRLAEADTRRRAIADTVGAELLGALAAL